MRLKVSFIFFLLLRWGITLFGQTEFSLPPADVFSLQNTVSECFVALQSGNTSAEDFFISGRDILRAGNPSAVRYMVEDAKDEYPKAISSILPIQSHVFYDYKSIAHGNIWYAVGIATAMLKDSVDEWPYDMLGRPMLLMLTDNGWKPFWIGFQWYLERFTEDHELVLCDNDANELNVPSLIDELSEAFLNEISNNDSLADDTDSFFPIPYCMVDVRPTFGGESAESFLDWVNTHIKYPDAARKQGLTGTVILQIVIGRDGDVQDVAIVKSAGERTKKDFYEELKVAKKISQLYENRLDDLSDSRAAEDKIENAKKQYDQAHSRYLRLEKIYASGSYVLPEYSVLDNEALRVVSMSPSWTPGENEGSIVPVLLFIGIDFKENVKGEIIMDDFSSDGFPSVL